MDFDQCRGNLSCDGERLTRVRGQRKRLLERAARKIFRNEVGHIVRESVVENGSDVGMLDASDRGGALGKALEPGFGAAQHSPDEDRYFLPIGVALGEIE